jgi:hypothetical protein
MGALHFMPQVIMKAPAPMSMTFKTEELPVVVFISPYLPAL